MGMRFLALLIVLAVTAASLASGATIHGTSYDYGLDVLRGVIVTINSTPGQSLVLANGTYSVELPKGKYQLDAGYYKDGQLLMSDSENVTIVDNGDYIIDLILLPEFDFDESIFDEEKDIGNISVGETAKSPQSAGADYSAVIIVLVIIAAGIIYYISKRGRTATKIETSKTEELPEDLDKVLGILRESGGRINQKELRDKLPYSEAKVSLMLSDLESRGLVKRFKKGRGNIVRLERS